MVSGLNKIRGMMYRLDEGYRQSVLLEDYDDFTKRWIDELNGIYKKDGSYGKKLYHSAGMHTDMSPEDVIRSICQNGLSVNSANDGDGIGKCIWFSDNFSDYGEKGWFVVSIELTGENKVMFELGYDGHNGYAQKDIPFNYLTVEVVPIIRYWMGFLTNVDAESDFYKKHDKSMVDVIIKIANQFPNKEVVMYPDAWDYSGIPYDMSVIEGIKNIKIENLGLNK